MIGVNAKGQVAAEFMSVARYAMFSQVYWHHTVRALKAMLARAVHALLAHHEAKDTIVEFQTSFVTLICALPEGLYSGSARVARQSGNGTTADMPIADGTDLAATDAAVLRWLHDRLTEAKRPEAPLITGILSRRPFRRLWVVTPDMGRERWHNIVTRWDKLTREKRYKLAQNFELAVFDFLSGSRGGHPLSADARAFIAERVATGIPWLVVDVPGRRAGAEVELHTVHESQGRRLRDDEHVVGESGASQTWKDYAGNLREKAGKIRIFCDSELLELVGTAMELQDGVDRLQGALEKLTP